MDKLTEKVLGVGRKPLYHSWITRIFEIFEDVSGI